MELQWVSEILKRLRIFSSFFKKKKQLLKKEFYFLKFIITDGGVYFRSANYFINACAPLYFRNSWRNFANIVFLAIVDTFPARKCQAVTMNGSIQCF